MVEQKEVQLATRVKIILDTLLEMNKTYDEQLRLSRMTFKAEGGNPYEYEMDRWMARDAKIVEDRAPLSGAIQALRILLDPDLSAFQWYGNAIYFDFPKDSSQSGLDSGQAEATESHQL